MAQAAPKIKFCGITTVPDARLALDAGAWAIGLVLWPRSKRRCPEAVAIEIAATFRRRVEVAGVFVNPTLEHVVRAADRIGLTMIQLHGDEGPAFCAEARRRTGCKVLKAARVRSRADIQALVPFHTDYHLLDSYVRGQRGGTGEPFAWELARAHRGPVPVILSGGLGADNVARAIEVARPFAVDVSSGVEAAPGRKDPVKLRAFANAVNMAGAHAPRPRPEHVPAGEAAHARPRSAIS